MKLKLEPQYYSGVSIITFYENVAFKADIKLLTSTKYSFDCTKINVGKNIQEALFEYMRKAGYDKQDIGRAWCIYGPKVDENLGDDEVEFSDDFIKIGDE